VAVQRLEPFETEAFVGLDNGAEIGPLVVFGLGGIFVEVLKRVTARVAPIGHGDALAMLAEFDDLGILDGVRGRRAWDRESLARLLGAVAELAAAPWIASVDINPLLVNEGRYVAVDALVLLREGDD
jgi:hypothetical protein